MGAPLDRFGRYRYHDDETMRAPKLLRQWRGTKSQKEAAEALHVAQSTLSDWEAARKCPEIAQAAVIERVAGIQIPLWIEVAEHIKKVNAKARKLAQRPSVHPPDPPANDSLRPSGTDER